MNKEGKSRLTCIATGGLCSLGLLSSAIASPPFGGGRSSLFTMDSVLSKLAASRSFAHQEHTSNAQLDLRLLGDSAPTIIHGGAAALVSTPFPSAIHHLNLGEADLGKDDRVQLPAFGTGGAKFREMSQAEIFARRVHREGLPVARLWESKSALLSIGLNQRGKPGLWLIQKIH
jgi:hypothetical protein